jgi:hypothetical protein
MEKGRSDTEYFNSIGQLETLTVMQDGASQRRQLQPL